MEEALVLLKGVKDAKNTEVIIKQILNHPSVFHYQALLEHPQVNQHKAQFQDTWDLLNLFAFGSYQQYLQSDLQKRSSLSLEQVKKF